MKYLQGFFFGIDWYHWVWFRVEKKEMKMKKAHKVSIPKSVSQHIEEEYTKSAEFRKIYDEEVARLRIAYQIEKLRQKRGLTQSELARKLKTTQQTISRLEDTKNLRFSVRTLTRIAAALESRLCVYFGPV
jgi:ribosome-binding protein aMBF1 (putative translation factor)